jgi:hypothetical protein
MKTMDSARHFIGQGREGMESDSEFLLPKSESELAMDADCTRVLILHCCPVPSCSQRHVGDS